MILAERTQLAKDHDTGVTECMLAWHHVLGRPTQAYKVGRGGVKAAPSAVELTQYIFSNDRRCLVGAQLRELLIETG
ncbi:hypothetical protein N7504_006293 [Penicillium tannophilum]|nr:hypothetical protein N7504_006293 [Penicillium tannophilum]